VNKFLLYVAISSEESITFVSQDRAVKPDSIERCTVALARKVPWEGVAE
jgi:hypothetical protein